jgi:hypothetical protein
MAIIVSSLSEMQCACFLAKLVEGARIVVQEDVFDLFAAPVQVREVPTTALN